MIFAHQVAAGFKAYYPIECTAEHATIAWSDCAAAIQVYIIIKYLTHLHKRGLKSPGQIRATGKEARSNYYVIRLTVLLQLTRTSIVFSH